MYNDTNDTEKLLRECDAGIKMGIATLDDVMNSVGDWDLEQRLKKSKKEHEAFRVSAEVMLSEIKNEGKDPNPIAKTMSHIKTKAATAVNKDDSTAAKLVIKGCEMGISSLDRYLGKYQNADSRSKSLARDVITEEQSLITDLRKYVK